MMYNLQSLTDRAIDEEIAIDGILYSK